MRKIATAGTFLILSFFTSVLWADGPGQLKFSESSFEVAEGVGLAVVSVERSGGEDGVVSVSYRTESNTAIEGEDFGATSGTFTWLDADESTQTFTIPIVDDSLAENAESLNLILENPTGGATLDDERGTATLIILANDGGSGGGGGGGGGGGTMLGPEDVVICCCCCRGGTGNVVDEAFFSTDANGDSFNCWCCCFLVSRFDLVICWFFVFCW